MLLTHFLNYLGVHVFSRLLPISAIFLFSFLLTPSELGVVSLHLATVWFLATILSGNLYAGVGRFLFDPDIADAPLLGTAVLAIAASSLVLGGMWVFFAADIQDYLFLPFAVLILQIPVALGLMSESTLTQVMIYQKRSQLLLRVMAAKSVLVLAGAIIGVSFLSEDRFLGVIVADAIAGVCLTFAAIRILWPHISWTFRRDYFSKLGRYSVPLVFYGLSLALLSQIDRVIIAHKLGTSAVGVYSLSYALGAMVLLLSVPVLNAFQPRFFDAMNSGQFSSMQLNATGLFALFIPMTAAVVAFGVTFARQVFPFTYEDGFSLIPLVALGALAQVHFVIWVRVLAYSNRTALISIIVAAAAILNITLNLMLIAPLGLFGAAISTVFAQFFMASALQIMLVRLGLPSQPLQWPPLLCVALLGLWYRAIQVAPGFQNLWVQGVFFMVIVATSFPLVRATLTQMTARTEGST